MLPETIVLSESGHLSKHICPLVIMTSNAGVDEDRPTRTYYRRDKLQKYIDNNMK